MGVFGGGIFGEGVYGSEAILTLTVQGTYPERVALSATGLVPGQNVVLSRKPAGSATRTTVRGADITNHDDDVLVRVDAEAPMGVGLTWYLTVDDLDLDTAVETLELAGGKVALSDAISGDSAEVVVLAWPSKRRERPSSVYAVGGRNIVVAGQRGGFSGTLDLYMETTDSVDNLFDLLGTATSGVLQIRNPGGYDGVDCYFSVLADDETRWSQDGTDDRRVISLDVVETRGWASQLTTSTYTYQDVADSYTGQTYADWDNDYATYLAAALGEYNA